MKNLLRLTLLSVLLFNALLGKTQDARILNVPYVYQVHLCCWCWAATCNSVIEYYGSTVSLCDIVEYARSQNTARFGTQNCCNIPTPTACINTNTRTGAGGSCDVLDHWGVTNNHLNNLLSFADVETEINAGRPVVFRWGWTGGGGHLLTCRGYDTPSTSPYYIDPSDGYHIATYAWVANNGTHTWTNTVQLTATPTCSDANSEFSQPINSEINYGETNTIEINSTIDNNANVQFRYGNSFIISSGFEIKKGSTLKIEPDNSLPCSP